ncbi:MAG: hypothetical protein QOJ44_2353, partial [Acidimicrobiaceae bacterium]|nr:hypothetical protein [Acidimicrobiaceae bacterium]
MSSQRVGGESVFGRRRSCVVAEGPVSGVDGYAGRLFPMTQFLEHWGYLAIFVLTVLESACIPIPSEVTLGLGGALSSAAFRSGSSTHLDLGMVIVVG